MHLIHLFPLVLLVQASPLLSSPVAKRDVPAPPAPEPITLMTLPLPPVVASSHVGACTKDVNPKGTGCMTVSSNLDFQAGGFLPDGKHVIAYVNYTGAPAAPAPESIYTGRQLIAIKTDGNNFPSGEPWKCLTCGLSEEPTTFDYPQAFADGKRVLFGTNILDCGEYDLVGEDCTNSTAHIYPIRWNTTPDGSGDGGSIRELRLHPDDVHLGFSVFATSNGKLGQFGYFGRLEFNSNPTTGLPLSPRYDLVKVTRLFDPKDQQPVETSGDTIFVNPDAKAVGEFRGFGGRGTEAVYVGYPAESSNIDVFAIHLQTGQVRRLTEHPEYCDPMSVSPDDQWIAIEDTRGTDRQMWLSGMRHIPPITDLISTSITSATRNNGQRRFFRAILLDRHGDRGDYFGQEINGGTGVAGSGALNDPEWNPMADPRWSPDGTQIVYGEAHTIAPACGGANPLPCYPSKEPGGRQVRVILATLTSRTPLKLAKVEPVSDDIPWGVAYTPGSADPDRPQPSPGKYTLKGLNAGYADVDIGGEDGAIDEVGITYFNHSDDGLNFLNGFEKVQTSILSLTLSRIHWYSNLTQTSDKTVSTKKTSADGFHLDIDVLQNVFEANGTLTTTLNGKLYTQPANRT